MDEQSVISIGKQNEASNSEQIEKERILGIEKTQPKTKGKWLLRSKKITRSLRLAVHDENTDKGKIFRQRKRSNSVGELGSREKSTCHKKLIRINTVDASDFRKKMPHSVTENCFKKNEDDEDEKVEQKSVLPNSPDGRRRGICEEMEKRMLCEGDSLRSLREAIIVQETLKNNFLL